MKSCESKNIYNSKRREKKKKLGFCSRCHVERDDYGKTKCTSCLKRAKEYSAQRYQDRKKNHLCVMCGRNPNDSPNLMCSICIDKSKLNNQRQRKTIRYRVIMAYGGKCHCCGIKEIALLTIDHMNNDGKQDREENGGRENFYRILYKLPMRTDIKISCFNCNVGRSMNGNICPHKKPFDLSMVNS